jgi:hypothetical protein
MGARLHIATIATCWAGARATMTSPPSYERQAELHTALDDARAALRAAAERMFARARDLCPSTVSAALVLGVERHDLLRQPHR